MPLYLKQRREFKGFKPTGTRGYPTRLSLYMMFRHKDFFVPQENSEITCFLRRLLCRLFGHIWAFRSHISRHETITGCACSECGLYLLVDQAQVMSWRL